MSPSWINLAAAGLALMCTTWCVTALFFWKRTAGRLAKKTCHCCGYPTMSKGRCAECGAPEDLAQRFVLRSRRRFVSAIVISVACCSVSIILANWVRCVRMLPTSTLISLIEWGASASVIRREVITRVQKNPPDAKQKADLCRCARGLLDSPSADIQGWAVRIICNAGSPDRDIANRIRNVLVHTPNTFLARDAAAALVITTDEDVLNSVRALLADPRRSFRLGAILGLRDRHDVALCLAPDLAIRLLDTDETVRYIASERLSQLGLPSDWGENAQLLAECAEMDDHRVKESIRKLIGIEEAWAKIFLESRAQCGDTRLKATIDEHRRP